MLEAVQDANSCSDHLHPLGILRTIHSLSANFSEDDAAWFQVTLPVKWGGLGVRTAVQLAYSRNGVLAQSSVPFCLPLVPFLFHFHSVLLANQRDPCKHEVSVTLLSDQRIIYSYYRW